MRSVARNISESLLDGFRHGLQWLELCVNQSLVPVIEKSSRWLLFLLRGVASVSRESTDTVRRILVLREEHRAAVTAHLGRAAGNGLRMLESLYQRPIVSVAQVQELTGTTFAAANSLVARLATLGILQEATGYRRNRVFRYAPFIAIFGDRPPATSSEFHGEQQ